MASAAVHPDRRTLCKVLLGRDDAVAIAKFLQELHARGSFDAAQKCSQHVAGALVILPAGPSRHVPAQAICMRLAAWQAPASSGEVVGFWQLITVVAENGARPMLGENQAAALALCVLPHHQCALRACQASWMA